MSFRAGMPASRRKLNTTASGGWLPEPCAVRASETARPQPSRRGMPGHGGKCWSGSFRLGIAGPARAPFRACSEAGLLVTRPVGIPTGLSRIPRNRDREGQASIRALKHTHSARPGGSALVALPRSLGRRGCGKRVSLAPPRAPLMAGQAVSYGRRWDLGGACETPRRAFFLLDLLAL